MTEPSRPEPRSEGGWTAVVLAGDRPGGDPLAAQFGVAAKALVPVGGEPMLGHVVRTLLGTPAVARILIVAQRPQLLRTPATAWIDDQPTVSFHAGGEGIASTLAAIVGQAHAPWPVLVTTADHPLLTRAMLEQFLGASGGVDLAFAVVERRVLLARYPGNRRTWLRFRGGAYSGANLFALQGPRAKAALDFWASAEADRKKALKLFWRFGPLLALRAITRTISLESAVRRAVRRLGFEARAVQLDVAEAAIDVDKPSDLALAEAILAARSAR